MDDEQKRRYHETKSMLDKMIKKKWSDEKQLEDNLARHLGLPVNEPIKNDWVYVIIFLDNSKKEVSGFACPINEFKMNVDENTKDKSSYCRLTTVMAKERIAYYREYYRDE